MRLYGCFIFIFMVAIISTCLPHPRNTVFSSNMASSLIMTPPFFRNTKCLTHKCHLLAVYICNNLHDLLLRRYERPAFPSQTPTWIAHAHSKLDFSAVQDGVLSWLDAFLEFSWLLDI